MGENDNISQMTPSFENICRKDEYGNKYWSSRDLCGAMGYSAYWKFQRVIDKAIKVAGEKGMNVDEQLFAICIFRNNHTCHTRESEYIYLAK